ARGGGFPGVLRRRGGRGLLRAFAQRRSEGSGADRRARFNRSMVIAGMRLRPAKAGRPVGTDYVGAKPVLRFFCREGEAPAEPLRVWKWKRVGRCLRLPRE